MNNSTSDAFPPPGYVSVPSKIEGIEIYRPKSPDEIPEQEIVNFKCPRCGATTAYSATDGGLICSHCGYYEPPQKAVVGKGASQLEFTVETMEHAEQGWDETRKEMECQSCGAFTSIPAESLTHTCPFCGSNQVIQRQAPQDVLRPRFLIPFKIEPAQCTGIAREWLGSNWMTPASLRNIAKLSKFTGVYLPYWTFDALTTSDWKAEVGHTKTERYYDNGEWKERTIVEWRWESGHVQLRIDDLIIPGTARLSQRLLSQINKFDLSSLTPYEPKYLAGLQAQAYDVPLEQSWEVACKEMRERNRQACMAQASTGQVRNFSMNLDFADESWRYILLPVYLTTYQYENNPFQVMINGQTSDIAGQRPVDWTKVWLVIALILSPGILIGLIGLVTIPLAGIGIGIGIVGFILLIVGIVIGLVILNKAQGLDDA